jgi:CelD/BcsL family acetyltransferase involved in cellulose biosynthesis
MAVRAELRGELGEIDEIADDWRALAVASGNPFLTPDWAHAWFRHYGDGTSPHVILVHDGDALVGVVPLARTGRTIRFVGDNVGDHFHPLALPGREAEVVGAARDGLRRSVRRGRLVLRNADVGAWTSTLATAWAARPRTVRVGATVLPYVPIAGETWDSYLAARSRNFRSQVRRKERALQRDHGARFRCTESPERVAPDMARFFALHNARWDTLGGSGAGTERFRAFHTDFATRALERGWLRLWFLEADGVEVAAWYGWRVGGRYAYCLAGFDPAWAEASVGLVLLAHTVRSAIEEGAAEYDLLLGDEPYKSRFATDERPVETVVLGGTLDPTCLAAGAEAGARRLAHRLPEGLTQRVRRNAGRLLHRLPGEPVR